MGDRVLSDNPAVTTYRGTVAASGATSRPRIELPSESQGAIPDGTVRLVLDGTTYHAAVRVTRDGPVIQGAYDNARLARSPGDGENNLPDWVDEMGLSIGRSVLVDEVIPETLYGARPPGTTVVYDTFEPPAASLSSIADGLEE